MTDDYLDISKSVMISSPAGSGKTEKLSRRYIALLKNGSDVEKILAITFTDKAAAEMKERILKILEKEDPLIFESVREKMPRMRISTIHSFCLKLLKRFCLDLDMDPSLEVMDGFNADILWNESVYESLLDESCESADCAPESMGRLFYGVIRKSGIKGWKKLHDVLNELHKKRPHIEYGLPDPKSVLHGDDRTRFEQILSIYSKCLEKYKRKKKERHCLDYNDLELLAYEAISRNPEWHNVLFAFDEHTDHILVDEFQDTSSLQWKIIDKLTEEWRSGLGSKRDTGLRPTVFLVGDDKQSIYSFRGANAGIFRNAREKLTEWLGEEYYFVEVKENYRSLPAIVEFVNSFFEKLMPKGLYENYRVEYTPFESTRSGEGKVELVLCEGIGNTKENRKAEAAVIAGKIKRFADNAEVAGKRGYGDMAILLRNRTHLSVFEDALRKEGVPFVVVKGVGFYNSPEIWVLKNLLFFLIDPRDDYSLINVLRSPLFSADYGTIFKTLRQLAATGQSSGPIRSTLDSISDAEEACAPHPLFPEKADDLLVNAAASIKGWLMRAGETPYSVLLEEVLCENGAWQYFHERQRYMNVKKFIRLIEGFESKGLGGLEIREKLIKASAKSDEAKANVNTEGMDAVKIMTVHGSKGLQFPVVFLPCLDEANAVRTGSIVMDEDRDEIIIGYEEDPDIRKTDPVFMRHREKIEDEEKRLFYVAATRAMDCLCMSGVINKKPSGKLFYLLDSYQISASIDQSGNMDLPFVIEKFRAEDLEELLRQPDDMRKQAGPVRQTSGPEMSDVPVFIDPLDYKPGTVWSEVTEEVDEDDVRKKHGEDWIVLGRVFHRVFEDLSKGNMSLDNLEARTTEVLRNEVLSDSRIQTLRDIILTDIRRLDGTGLLKEIILPRDSSYSELPFVLDDGMRVYKGRIDRIIIRDNTAFIYDYKTYPISENEIEKLRERYFFQMRIYKEAVEKLFGLKTASYLFFTHDPRIVSVA